MTAVIKMEKYQWINPENHSIAVDDQKQPVLNENGDLIVLDNETGKCISVPNSDDVLEIFGFGYSAAYVSPSGSPKGSSPDRDSKPIVQVVTDADQLLWSMRTPCQKDIEATREMLSLVASKRYQDMFNDQCTVKIRVWKRICEELMAKGYRIADSVNEGGIKCHQKWRNLEKSYRNYLICSTDPNSPAPKKPPPYFEALHEILKSKKKYANAVAYTQTVVVSGEDIIDPDTSSGGGGGGGGGGEGGGSEQNHQPQPPEHHLNDSDVLEELEEDADGMNDDHCYVVNCSGQVSKRMKIEPLMVCSTTGMAGVQTNSRRSGQRNVQQQQQQQQHYQQQQHRQYQYQQRQNQQQSADTLEQILENVVRVQRDMITMHEKHFSRMEKLMRENSLQTKRLADVMGQLLRTTREGGDCDKGSTDVD